ncbi:MAG: glutamate 5-kinase [Candidatus Diapherotrites archaeon]|nr:glutamate 5-kinase [Candidatus Diapherotrites archaeon]
MGKRIIVKIGTNAIMKNGRLDKSLIADFAKDIMEFKKKGFEFAIVTSGSIGLGLEKLGLDNNGLKLEEQQACAAIGQSILMKNYEREFSKYNQTIAQLLLTQENFSNKEQLQNLKSTLEKLFSLNVLPIINENDSVSTRELKVKKEFSDNDSLSALVASHCKASMLVLATDVEGIFLENPKANKDAKFVKEVKNIEDLKGINAGGASARGRGGFLTKVSAAKKVALEGIDCIICKGRKGIIREITCGKNPGTIIHGVKK